MTNSRSPEAVLLAGFGVRQRMAMDPLILPSLLANRGFAAGMLDLSVLFDSRSPT